MIERFRANFPNTPAQYARIRDSDFFNTCFDALIAWGVLFHLTPADQEEAIAKVSRSLKLGGKFELAKVSAQEAVYIDRAGEVIASVRDRH